MGRPRLRVWTLMVIVALVAVGFGAAKLRQRGRVMSLEAARHAEKEREWLRRRVQYRRVLAGRSGEAPVKAFYFRSVLYETPEHWERAMGEILAYHAGARRAYGRAAQRPWESVALPSR